MLSRIQNVEGNAVRGEKGKNITLRWNFYGFEDNSVLQFYKGSIQRKNTIGKMLITIDNITYPIQPMNNILRNFSGSCTFPNENGTCQITLTDLRYDDADVFHVIDSGRGEKIFAQVNVSLVVRGEMGMSRQFFAGFDDFQGRHLRCGENRASSYSVIYLSL